MPCELSQPNMSPGEVIAELMQGHRNRVLRGEETPQEAILRSNKEAYQLWIRALADNCPFEAGSTQIGPLIEEGRRLRAV